MPAGLFQTSNLGSQLSQSDGSTSTITIFALGATIAHSTTLHGSKRRSSPVDTPSSPRLTVSYSRGADLAKRRKTAPARAVVCCSCSPSAICSQRNCSCAIAGRPCHNCDPGTGNKCRNTLDELNARVDQVNSRRGSKSSQLLRQHVGLKAIRSPVPHVRPPEDRADGDHDEEPVDTVPPLVLLPAGDTSASTQASDINDAELTQDSVVAAMGDEMGNPTIHSDGDVGSGNTAEEAGGAEPVTADAVIPNPATNTADNGAIVEVAGGGVQVAAPIDGDNNPPVQIHDNAEGPPDAASTRGARGDQNVQLNGVAANGREEAGTPPPTVPTAEVAADGNPPAEMEYYTPIRLTAEEIMHNDPNLQGITPADRKLIEVYGDTIHQNDSRHLDGGIGIHEDRKWQRLHFRVASCTLALYDLPNGRWANRFLEIQTKLWCDTRQRVCNSEKPLIFAACILCKVKDVKRFSDVKQLIWAEEWKRRQWEEVMQ